MVQHVWNEDLVNAMNARHQQAWQQQRQSQYKWREGAKTIESVRKDIRLTTTGKIFNLPTQNTKSFPKTVYEECVSIIKGEKPIYPPGYTPLRPSELKTMQESSFLPYIEQLKRESGGYAILLAFHVSQRDTLSKDEICKIGQEYCKEQMLENYHAGRMYGAWKGNETLARHGLITVHKAGARWTERGFRSNGKNSYMITPDGKKAIQQILKKWPDINIRMTATPSRTPATSVPLNPFSPRAASPRMMHTPPAVKQNAKSRDDEKELRDWVRTALIGAQKVFKVGKDRRLFLHRLCDQLLESEGLRLEHESFSEGQRKRHLYITLRERRQQPGYGSLRPNTPTIATSARRSLDFSLEGYSSKETSTAKKRSHSAISVLDEGYTLFDSCSSTKKRRPAKVAAGEAALARLEQHQKRSTTNIRTHVVETSSPLIEILSDDDDSKPRHRLKQPPKANKEVLYDYQPGEFCQLRSTEVLLPPSERGPFKILRIHVDGYISVQHPSNGEWKVNAKKVEPYDSEIQVIDTEVNGKAESKINTPGKRRRQAIRNSNTSENEIIELLEEESIEISVEPSKQTETRASHTPAPATITSTSSKRNLTILIDDRERSRNHKPREMRIELTKEVENNLSWKNDISGVVQERKLPYGDFAFEVTTTDNSQESSKLLSVTIERKRIADLIQRSARGDHWKQLGRMKFNCQHVILLLEGDSKVASRFDPYGIQGTERKISHHTIENDEDLFLFIGRSIISSPKIKIVQTRDERGTYRFVTAVSMVANESPKTSLLDNTQTSPFAKEQNVLKDLLISGGIDWRIAKEIAFQVGSVTCLGDLYNSCSSREAKELLMEPIIRNLDEEELGRIDFLSRTVFEVFAATEEDRSQKRRQCEDIKIALGEGACNYSTLLHFLYRSDSPDAALNDALDYGGEGDRTTGRRVIIECSQTLSSFFESPTDNSFYTLSSFCDNSSDRPVVKFLTACDNICSNKLFVHMLEGSNLVEDACSSFKDPFVSKTLLGAAKQIAESINNACESKQESTKQASLKNNQDTRRVLLIRGLNPAISKAAKSSDYRTETNLLCDMIMTSLMIDHDMVVLQAMRKDISETKMILRQIALACYHYHLLPNCTGKP